LEQALGVAVATRLLSDAERLSPALAGTRRAGERFWRELRRGTEAGEGRTVVHGDFWVGSSRDAYHELDSALDALAAVAETASCRVSARSGPASLPGGTSRTMLADAFDVARRRSQLLRDELASVVDGAPGRIAWFEKDAKKAALSSSPVDVSGIFRDHVFDRIPAVVLTSATLSSGAAPSAPPDAVQVSRSQQPQFRFLRSRLGLDEPPANPLELVVESPFDFASRALLYVPDDLPAPGEDGFSEAASERIVELVELTGGGAFVLATSVRAMRRLYQALRARLSGALVLMQGEAPKSTLIALFKEHGNAVLVATLSFWQGVDVPGAALRLVVLDKIPFPVPSDPIVTARSQALEESGRNAFMELHVPLAQITLKQGFGRLIRTRTDSGIVALFDPRVHRRGYGRRLIGALPKARTVRRLEEVRAFWLRVTAPQPSVLPL
jgi:ATP-dependent DNA helicase DinG